MAALLALLLLVVLAGRVAQAEGDVRRAASDAARAASLRQYADDAETAAGDAAAADLEAAAGVACVRIDSDVDTSAFAAGGTVGVTVRCTVSMSDVALLGVPGDEPVARSVEVIDRFRAAP